MLTRADLSPRQLAALKCRVDLTAFSRAIYKPYRHARHFQYIDAALMDVARYLATDGREGTGKLLIEAPLRHGKSQKACRIFPSWVLGKLPDTRVIIASHTATLSGDHSRIVRNNVRDPMFGSIFPHVRLADDSQDKQGWDLAEPNAGGLFSVGTTGAIVGRGGNLILADDLFASREEYESKTQRDKIWTWFADELSTRAAPVCAFVLIGSRWGLDDIQGRIELQEADQWRVINLPALAEDADDPLGRQPGEALWPSDYPRAKLLEIQQRLGEYSFAALYQQRPVSSAGGVFRREKFHIIDDMPPNVASRIRFWDMALSQKTAADNTAGCLLAEMTDKRLIIEDMETFQQDWADIPNRIALTAHRDGPSIPIAVEAAFFHGQVIRDLMRRDDMRSFRILEYKPTTDKLTRALPFAARCDADMVYILRRAWTQDVVDEFTAFPGGRRDDRVDSVTGAYAMIGRAKPLEVAIRRYA